VEVVGLQETRPVWPSGEFGKQGERENNLEVRHRAKGVVRKVRRGLTRAYAKPEDERRQGSSACRQPVVELVEGREHPEQKGRNEFRWPSLTRSGGGVLYEQKWEGRPTHAATMARGSGVRNEEITGS
jgi:hypothetical protein